MACPTKQTVLSISYLLSLHTAKEKFRVQPARFILLTCNSLTTRSSEYCIVPKPDTIEKVKRDRLIIDYLPLVRAIAVRIRRNLPAHVELDDLVQVGILGLIDAATKYNPAMETPFPGYAKHRITGCILDGLRKLDVASRSLRRQQKRIEAVTRELTAELGRAPTEHETVERLGIDIEQFRQLTLDLHSVGVVSADTRSDGSD